MRISFGSTYAIKYNYTLMKAYGYATPDSKLRTFIGTYNSLGKDKDEISAINPGSKTYYIKMSDSKDKEFEEYAKELKVKSKIKKVDDNKMRGAIVTSIGQSNEELHLISKRICDYKYGEN